MNISDDLIEPYEEVEFSQGLVTGWTGSAQAVDIRADGAVPHLLFDRALFRRLMTNLLTNAAKHAGPDAKVTVSFDREVSGGISMSVEDDGPGVNPALLPGFREPFKRGPSLPKVKMDGVGLGLWIVDQIAKAHECKCEIASALGECFRVTLRIPAFRVHERHELSRVTGSGI